MYRCFARGPRGGPQECRALSGSGSHVIASDLFSAVRKGRAFDLICANLPYVALREWEGLMAEVKDFEPRTALVGGDAGTELYERYLEKIGDVSRRDGTAPLRDRR